MAFNGSGQFSFPYSWTNDAANGIPITASRMDGQFNDAVSGFDLCLTRDGQGFATANLPMGGFQHTGAADATANGQYLTYNQVLNASLAGSFLSITNAGLTDISGAAAGQIKFPAVQNASANANTLDDYEEGTFTPTVIGSGGSNSHTYGTTIGQYTKIGRLVSVQARVSVIAFDAWSGNVSIGGLPFACAGLAAGYGGYGIGIFSKVTLTANYTQVGLTNIPGTTTLSFQQSANNGGSAANIATTAVANGFDFAFSGSYIV